MIRKEFLASLLLMSSTAIAAYTPVVEISEETLMLVGEVTDTSVAPLISAIEKNGNSKKELTVFIDSIGGSVVAGQRVIASVERNNAKLTCIVGEKAYSAAFFMLQVACNKRLVMESSSLLEHRWQIGLSSATIETQEETIKAAKSLFYSIRVKEAKRLKISYEELIQRSNRNWQMLGIGAVKEGAADSVVTVKCTQGAIAKRVKTTTNFVEVERSYCPFVAN